MEEKFTRKVNKKPTYSQKPDKQTQELTEKCQYCKIKSVVVKLANDTKICQPCYQDCFFGLFTKAIKFCGTFQNPELLTAFSCQNCQQSITVVDIAEKNYSLFVSDYQNQILKSEFGGQIFYGLNFWLRKVNHELCPLQKEKSNFTITQERAGEKPLTQLHC